MSPPYAASRLGPRSRSRWQRGRRQFGVSPRPPLCCACRSRSRRLLDLTARSPTLLHPLPWLTRPPRSVPPRSPERSRGTRSGRRRSPSLPWSPLPLPHQWPAPLPHHRHAHVWHHRRRRRQPRQSLQRPPWRYGARRWTAEPPPRGDGRARHARPALFGSQWHTRTRSRHRTPPPPYDRRRHRRRHRFHRQTDPRRQAPRWKRSGRYQREFSVQRWRATFTSSGGAASISARTWRNHHPHHPRRGPHDGRDWRGVRRRCGPYAPVHGPVGGCGRASRQA